MAEFLGDWMKNPIFWVALFLLIVLFLLNRWVYLRSGRKTAVVTAVLASAVIVFFFQLLDLKAFSSPRLWVAAAIIVGICAGPALLLPLALKAGVRKILTAVLCMACALFGAFAFPVVALFTVCALGIDCL